MTRDDFQFQQSICRQFRARFERMDATERSTFLGSFIANLVGPFDDQSWREIQAVAPVPCGEQDCGCESVRVKAIEALTIVRDDWREQMRGI